MKLDEVFSLDDLREETRKTHELESQAKMILRELNERNDLEAISRIAEYADNVMFDTLEDE